MSNYTIYPMKDNYKKYKIIKKDLFDMPFRLLIIGKSELSGKSNLIGNLLLRDNFYKDMFKPENIYIICQSENIDHKWKVMIEQLEIPESNVCQNYDEDYLEALYELIKEEYEEAIENKKQPQHNLIIFDDVSFDGSLNNKKNGIISKLMCNGRHLLISSIQTAQKYSSLSTTSRENCTSLILFSCTNKQLDLIYEDHGLINKKAFIKMFREITDSPYSFMVINYSNKKNERYQDSEFKPIDYNKFLK